MLSVPFSRHPDDAAATIARRRAIVPIVAGGHILALGITLGLLLPGPAGTALVSILLAAPLSLLALAVETVVISLARRRRMAPGAVAWAAAGTAPVQGGSLAMLAGAVAAMPRGMPHEGAVAAMLLACALMTALYGAARLPLLLFCAALLATSTGLIISPVAAGAAMALLLPAAWLIVHRLDAADRPAQAAADEAEADRGLAARLVREFETQGGGWFWETDADGRLTYLSDPVRQIVDRPGRPAIGTPLTDIFRLAGLDAELERTLGFHLSTRTSFLDYGVQANGVGDRWWSISGRPLMDAEGRYRGFTGNGGDLTEKRRAEAEISRMALSDALTGLPNRQRMRLSLDRALMGGGTGVKPAALLLLDLDRFKAVNDTMGHKAGDALLRLVGDRLARTIGEGGLVGRPGGDEFQIILPYDGERERLAALAAAVIAAMSAPYAVNGTTIALGCSIGIALAPDHGDDAETLIRNADLALSAAKAEGRGIHSFYRPQMLAAAQSRRQLEEDLRQAFVRQQFHLVYQPVVSTRDERIVGYEALLRWDHPERGPVSPAEFVPVAEECGLIEKIGEWVLRTACADAASWPGEVRVAVNVSPIQFANPALPALVVSALGNSGLPATRLELEITEGVFLSDGGATDRMFAALKSIGVRLALDDFGTGYSSLGYLKQAPFDKIKIDQSFVRGAAIEGSRNAAIIRAIVSLAGAMGMETTAEGVEFADEIVLIRDLGCSHIQGYVYGKPVRHGHVLNQLGASEGQAAAPGIRVSRAPRMSMLRSATVEVGQNRGTVRIRNITSHGVMIDGIGLLAPGTMLRIELFPGEVVDARVRWCRDNKAGLRFDRPIELERMLAAAEALQRVA